MRDIVLSFVILGLLPLAARQTWIGVMLWTWLSIMNPHRLTFGFAYSMPWAQMAAVATVLSLFIGKDRPKMIWSAPVVALIVFIVWVCITTAFAVDPGASLEQLVKVLKIQLFTLIAFAAVQERRHIIWFVAVNALSVAFYGFKGGLFIIRSGGGERVWGPSGSFIEGNNEVGLAIIMIVPLLYFLRQLAKNAWIRAGLLVLIALCAIAAIGTYSRGALLAIIAMGAVLWWRAPRRLVNGFTIVVVAVVALSLMPAKWTDRMNTIETYQQDNSAMGRINAWTMAFNLANDRVLGAGFDATSQKLFERYAPIPKARAAHSIYFQVLGEHGWIGLAMFLSIGLFSFMLAGSLRRRARGVPEAQWVYYLAGMLQVSMVGYAVGGAFLSLAYFDLPYNIVVILVACDRWLREKRWIAEAAPSAAGKPVGPTAGRTDGVLGMPSNQGR